MAPIATETAPALKKYDYVPGTEHESMHTSLMLYTSADKIVEWADLASLDLSLFDVPGGKQKLANQLKDAVHRIGEAIHHDTSKKGYT